jgi:hypothetical protein
VSTVKWSVDIAMRGDSTKWPILSSVKGASARPGYLELGIRDARPLDSTGLQTIPKLVSSRTAAPFFCGNFANNFWPQARRRTEQRATLRTDETHVTPDCCGSISNWAGSAATRAETAGTRPGWHPLLTRPNLEWSINFVVW